jgi:hypothetical protein
MKLKTDKLAVSVYAHHGDTCSNAPHCKSLGCASGFASDEFVLSAKFAYLQEAIDYAQAISARGVRARLVSRIVAGAPYISDYPKAGKDARTPTNFTVVAVGDAKA